MFRTVFPSIIRSSRLYIQQQASVKQMPVAVGILCYGYQKFQFRKKSNKKEGEIGFNQSLLHKNPFPATLTQIFTCPSSTQKPKKLFFGSKNTGRAFAHCLPRPPPNSAHAYSYNGVFKRQQAIPIRIYCSVLICLTQCHGHFDVTILLSGL